MFLSNRFFTLEGSVFPAVCARSCGISHHQLGMQEQRADRYFIHQAVQCIIAAFSQFDPFLTDCGQGRGGIGADGRIIKADDA